MHALNDRAGAPNSSLGMNSSGRPGHCLTEEFEDSSADLVVAALILNSKLRGSGLVATLALATAAREEIDMRPGIEEGRKSLRRTAMIIVGATGLFAGGVLTVLSRDYVARTPRRLVR